MLLLSSALRQIALAVDDRALDLRFDAERIHQHAAVDGRLHAVHADLPLLVGRDLGAVGDDAVDGIVHRQPARAALRRRRVPAGHARRALQYFEMARFALEKTHAKLEWIAPGCPVQRRRAGGGRPLMAGGWHPVSEILERSGEGEEGPFGLAPEGLVERNAFQARGLHRRRRDRWRRARKPRTAVVHGALTRWAGRRSRSRAAWGVRSTPPRG